MNVEPVPSLIINIIVTLTSKKITTWIVSFIGNILTSINFNYLSVNRPAAYRRSLLFNADDRKLRWRILFRRIYTKIITE